MLRRTLKTYTAILAFVFGTLIIAAPAVAQNAPPLPSAASTSGGSDSAKDLSYFVPPSTDVSMGMLQRLLGGVVNPNPDSTQSAAALSGEGTLGAMMRQYNLAVAIFGSIIILWIVIAGSIETSISGEFLGRKWSSAWVPVRFALGSAMLLPLSATGYSLVQSFVLQVAIWGIGAADHIWTAVVKSAGAARAGVSIQVTLPANDTATKLMRSALCMATQQHLRAVAPDLYGTTTVGSRIAVADDGRTMRMFFGDPTNVGDQAICGMMSYSPERNWGIGTARLPTSLSDWEAIAGVDNSSNAFMQQMAKIHKDSATGMLASFSGPAEEYRAAMAAVEDTTIDAAARKAKLDAARTAVVNAINTGAKNYMSTIRAAVDHMAELPSTYSAQPYLLKAQNQGWAVGGAWSFELAKVQEGMAKAARSPLTISAPAGGERTYELLLSDLQPALDKARSDPSANLAQIGSTGRSGSSVDAIDSQFLWGIGQDSPEEVERGVTQRLSEAIIAGMTGVRTGETYENNILDTGWGWTGINSNSSGWNSSNSESVLSQLKSRGDWILNLASVVQIGAAAGGLFSKGADVVGKVNPLTKAVAWLSSGLGAMLLTVAGALVLIGLLFAVVLPSMPYVLYTASVIGFLILVIESLLAAPLWAVLHLHPDGEGFASSYTKQGYMLLLVLFMRASLIVAGLYCGMLLLEPAISLVNATFFPMMRTINSNTMITGVYITIGFMIVYCGLVMWITYRCFGLVHAVPDRVLRWIGGSGEQLGESESMGGLRGAVGHAASELTSVAGRFGAMAAERAVKDTPSEPTKTAGGPDGGGTVAIEAAVARTSNRNDV